MRNPSINLRIPPKLLKTLQQEAKQNQETIQQLIRTILKTRTQRKTRQTLAYGFAGPAKKQIKTYEDRFSEPKRSARKKIIK